MADRLGANRGSAPPIRSTPRSDVAATSSRPAGPASRARQPSDVERGLPLMPMGRGSTPPAGSVRLQVDGTGEDLDVVPEEEQSFILHVSESGNKTRLRLDGLPSPVLDQILQMLPDNEAMRFTMVSRSARQLVVEIEHLQLRHDYTAQVRTFDSRIYERTQQLERLQRQVNAANCRAGCIRDAQRAPAVICVLGVLALAILQIYAHVVKTGSEEYYSHEKEDRLVSTLRNASYGCLAAAALSGAIALYRYCAGDQRSVDDAADWQVGHAVAAFDLKAEEIAALRQEGKDWFNAGVARANLEYAQAQARRSPIERHIEVRTSEGGPGCTELPTDAAFSRVTYHPPTGKPEPLVLKFRHRDPATGEELTHRHTVTGPNRQEVLWLLTDSTRKLNVYVARCNFEEPADASGSEDPFDAAQSQALDDATRDAVRQHFAPSPAWDDKSRQAGAARSVEPRIFHVDEKGHLFETRYGDDGVGESKQVHVSELETGIPTVRTTAPFRPTPPRDS